MARHVVHKEPSLSGAVLGSIQATDCSSTLIIRGCNLFRVYLSMMVGSESVSLFSLALKSSKFWKEYVHFRTRPASYHYDFPALISPLCENGNSRPEVDRINLVRLEIHSTW